MILKKRSFTLVISVAMVVLISSCHNKQVSQTTGWEYNNSKLGGFELPRYREQATGPGLVFIEGGTFVMGRNIDHPMQEWDNVERRVTVPSFYMDETEVSNLDYLEYLYWLDRVYGETNPEVYQRALPDTLVWRSRLAYNDPLVETYFRHPAYMNYPVVGVTWIQANEYCTWRTDRVNEMILIKHGILEYDPDQTPRDNFNTEAYLAGQYEGLVNKNLKNLDPKSTGERIVRLEDGILLPRYRLPTEAEWEFAALGLIGNTKYERIAERNMYPWKGNNLRAENKKDYGSLMANFRRGRGDYMGVAGSLNDGADIPADVRSYWPNDYGLYNMAGNVAEWVQDVFRPLTFADMDDYRPFRGNVFKTRETLDDGQLVEKDSMGRIRYRDITDEEAVNRFNYRTADNRNYLDGDQRSLIDRNMNEEVKVENTTVRMYEYGKTSLISDKSRVYKGGSWRDPAHYLSPGARRYLDEDKSTNYIGFRCAMTRTGSTTAAKKR
ncbi:MAG: SUMF1/EgtB/PvdO family nonheme iron enzyme [Bacteroidales bacterium]|jgi:gliding motility-associated lipoprotein GldJ|nr:SUMF1/EgtB/PvdO family nonheme iron enzyme [Bacteroidales bacterium]